MGQLRLVLRRLGRAPGFTAISLLTIAFGVGATTAIFSVVNGVLLKPLPFANPDQLVRIASVEKGSTSFNMSAPDFVDYRDQSHNFADMVAMDGGTSVNLTRADAEAVRLREIRVGAT
ncbi:MAG: ABC transporter permease, partial [Terriglobia bacterium]